MMQLGYLTGQYPRATDTFIQREIFALRDLGFEVQTFSIRKPSLDQLVGQEQKTEVEKTNYLLPPHIIAYFFAHLFLAFTRGIAYLKSLNLAWKTRQKGLKGFIFQLFYFIEAGYLARKMQQQNIQHLHNHIADSSCTVAMLAAELSGISFSFTIHGPYIFFEPYRWALTEKIERALFVSCISHFCRSQCMLFSSIDHWHKLHIVHCGVATHQFDCRTHQGPGKHLLYTGRLAAAKGLPVLLEGLAALKEQLRSDFILTVIGDGPDRDQLESQVSNLDLSQNVRFVGYQSQSEVRRYLKSTDIFILPSFAEGVPVSLMEALASGVPVITTQIAGISELVENGKSGYLVAPGDAKALTKKIVQLFEQPQLRQSFGEVGREKVVRAFDVMKEAKWLSEILLARQKGQVVSVRDVE